MNKNAKTLIFLLIVLSGLIACNELDIKLVNQIKTFGPRWSAMGEKLNFIDRNLVMMEGKFERNYNELEPIFDQIPDSLKWTHLKNLLSGYQDIVEIRDSLRGNYRGIKTEYVSSVGAFHSWEKKVMNGEVEQATASTELKEFRENYHLLDAELMQIEAEMSFIANEHNRIFNGLTGALDVPTKYEVKLK